MSEKISYTHQRNLHTNEGAKDALTKILGGTLPDSLLDIGCGTGTWLSAAQGLGVKDLKGVDGIRVADELLAVSPDLIEQRDFRKPWTIGRTFDLSICLEVAEHIDEEHADRLITEICKTSDQVFFSAAAPYQGGDHHVNCQWPEYWQKKFNDNGFSCDDEVRWKIWDESLIEPWYRQDIFFAKSSDQAGSEARIKGVYHSDMIQYLKLKELAPRKFLKGRILRALGMNKS